MRTTRAAHVTTPARPIDQVDVETARGRAPPGSTSSTGCSAAGSCRGAVVLLAGEPGVGKSTLLLDVAARDRRAPDARVLYVTGEESAAQVRLRAERIGALRPQLFLAAETDLATVLGHIEQVAARPAGGRLGADHRSGEVEGTAGSVSQVREVAAALIRVAKERDMATVLVGHVTKDGSIAGPRTLEHLVDVVCQFEGERHSRLRLVRAVKNRYGPTDEVGCFDLSEDGIVGLTDPSGLFLSRTRPARVRAPASPSPWRDAARWSPRCRRWSRPPQANNPRRATSGLDCSPGRDGAGRAAAPDAGRRWRARTSTSRPSAACGSASPPPTSRSRWPLAAAALETGRCRRGLVAFGEVGLAGEVRPVPGVGRRLAEAARLGFTTAVVPPGGTVSVPVPDGLKVIEIGQRWSRPCRLGVLRGGRGRRPSIPTVTGVVTCQGPARPLRAR